jgi:hypothetical protein
MAEPLPPSITRPLGLLSGLYDQRLGHAVAGAQDNHGSLMTKAQWPIGRSYGRAGNEDGNRFATIGDASAFKADPERRAVFLEGRAGFPMMCSACPDRNRKQA